MPNNKPLEHLKKAVEATKRINESAKGLKAAIAAEKIASQTE